MVLYEKCFVFTAKTSFIGHVLLLKLKCVSRDRNMLGELLKATKYSCIGIFVLNQEQLKNCLFPTKTGEAFVHMDKEDAIFN